MGQLPFAVVAILIPQFLFIFTNGVLRFLFRGTGAGEVLVVAKRKGGRSSFLSLSFLLSSPNNLEGLPLPWFFCSL